MALVERMAIGMEVECSVIGNATPLVSQPGEIVAHADWYDYEAKYTPGGMELVMPPRLDGVVIERVRALGYDTSMLRMTISMIFRVSRGKRGFTKWPKW